MNEKRLIAYLEGAQMARQTAIRLRQYANEIPEHAQYFLDEAGRAENRALNYEDSAELAARWDTVTEIFSRAS